MSIFQGSAVAIVTPFNETGVNFEKLKALLQWHIKEGTDAIVICGTTGEATTMTEKEKKPSIHERLEINKRIIQEKQGKDKPERGADLDVRTV